MYSDTLVAIFAYNEQKKISDVLNEVTKKFCNVLVGGSSAFGMGATSDKKTISSQLSNTGIFCQNFGVRGATSQQELIIFQNSRFFYIPVFFLY